MKDLEAPKSRWYHFTKNQKIGLVIIFAHIFLIGLIIYNTEKQSIEYVASKILGWMIVIGSIFIKVPQIYKIYEEESSEGIAASMFYLELITGILTVEFSLYNDIPFSIYGESVFLSIANNILIYQIWNYDLNILPREKYGVSAFMIILSILLRDRTFLNHDIWDLLLSLATLINVSAKLPQIIKNFQNRSIG